MRNSIRRRRGVGVRSDQLASEFSVSRWHLEHVFHIWLGISPAEYISTVRLNEFRSELLRPDNRNQTIDDIAARFEIWHLSRLSQLYRRHFGELPSKSRLDFKSCPHEAFKGKML